MSKFNRRSFLKAVGVGAGAAMGARMAPGLLGEAQAANTPTGKGAVLVLTLDLFPNTVNLVDIDMSVLYAPINRARLKPCRLRKH